MQKSFSADIQININKETKNIVRIIPFYDSDKRIAKTIENVLNQSLNHDETIDFGREDGLRRMTAEIS